MRGVSTLFAEGQKQDIFFNTAAEFLRLDKSIYLPGATEYYDESGARVVEVVASEIRVRVKHRWFSPAILFKVITEND